MAIGGDAIAIPLDDFEFTYSNILDHEEAFVFFDQESMDRKKVVVFEDGRELCRVIKKSFGMEYFLSNRKNDYLIAVNWYVIEVAGNMKARFSDLGGKLGTVMPEQ